MELSFAKLLVVEAVGPGTPLVLSGRRPPGRVAGAARRGPRPGAPITRVNVATG